MESPMECEEQREGPDVGKKRGHRRDRGRGKCRWQMECFCTAVIG